ncbi:hypothetical protein MKW92_049340 [Papaver armeniacum]|nr:hypothetical protein MKW92_049340 [Papaver armeniacum]
MHLAQNHGRKTKGVKMTSEPFGSGSSWTQFEDQALVVLIHDMGPNWELVSDVINSTLQFKCIFHKPKDCKERHKFLMGRKSAGDGADSAHDSGVVQGSCFTVCGVQWKRIPLRLTLRRSFPLGNTNILVKFRPLDHCDAASPDLSHGYQGSHSSSLGIANQGYVAPVLPTSGLVLVLSPCYKDLLILWSKTNFTDG